MKFISADLINAIYAQQSRIQQSATKAAENTMFFSLVFGLLNAAVFVSVVLGVICGIKHILS